MNRFAHHASRRAATASPEVMQTRFIAVPALLFIAGIVLAVSIGALEAGTTTAAAPVPEVTIEEVPIAPFGA